MKGDMWDDGTPNPLVVKCPICGCTDIGTMIGSGQVEYHCHNCKHAWFARGDEYSTTGPIQYSPPSATSPSYSITTDTFSVTSTATMGSRPIYNFLAKGKKNMSKEGAEITIDDVWKELEVGDETKSVSAGLLVGELIAAIISARHKQKLSQADLAQKMNVSVSCIRRMERLNSMPRIDTVFQAALVLGVLKAKWRKADDR